MATIYLADQDSGYRKGLAHALRQRGSEVEEFESGSELYARAVTREPDLIVMETDLGEMDGFQVFARLQSKRPEKPFPVLFVTQFDHPRVARICKQRGALGYVGKGRSVDHVVATIQSFIDEEDPLSARKLPAALAWLQSRGKSGRLEIQADGTSGFVLLHKGRVLDASWGSLQGDEALVFFAEELAGARFRFAEGADELDPPEVAARPSSSADAAAAASSVAPASPPRPMSTLARSPGRLTAPEVQAPASGTRGGGAVAALRELGIRERRNRALRGARRVVGAAAALALLLVGGLALAAAFPGYVPGLAGVLNGLGITGGERQTEPEASELARHSEAESPAVRPPAKADVRTERGAEASREAGATRDAARIPAPGASFYSDGSPQSLESAPPTVLASVEEPPVRDRPAASERQAAPARAVTRPAPNRETPRERREVPPEAGPAEPLAETQASPLPASGEQDRPAPSVTEPPVRKAETPSRPVSDPAPEVLKRPVLLQRGTDPYYPPELKVQGVGGSVVLNIRVGVNGRAQRVEVLRSSGYEAFDQAAVAAIGTFLWEPARDASGPTETWTTQAVTFRP